MCLGLQSCRLQSTGHQEWWVALLRLVAGEEVLAVVAVVAGEEEDEAR